MKTDTRLLIAARAWWISKRPAGWTEQMHIGFPMVNCAGDAERELARLVASLEQL